jgi:hypothetical protein
MNLATVTYKALVFILESVYARAMMPFRARVTFYSRNGFIICHLGQYTGGRVVFLHKPTITATDAGKYFCIFDYFLADRAYLMGSGSEMGNYGTARDISG